MNKILAIGRWLFPLSFLLYVGLHFGKADVGADFVPDYLPFPYFWNYFTGICILAFIISALLGKYDKLAYTLMALYVFLMALLIHLPNAGTSENEMLNVFRNIMVAAALMGYARYIAKDERVIG